MKLPRSFQLYVDHLFIVLIGQYLNPPFLIINMRISAAIALV